MNINWTARALLALFCCLSFNLKTAKAAVDLRSYDHLDPQHIVPDHPLRQALSYLETYKDKFPNQ